MPRDTRPRLARRSSKSPPGKASDYIQPAKRLRQRGLLRLVVLYVRVSSGPQDKAGNLGVQLARLHRYAEKFGIVVLTVFQDVGSGWAFDANPGLASAAAYAKAHGAVLLATSADRFLRSKAFHTVDRPGVLTTKAEYERFMAIIGDVTVATLLPPDMPWAEVRGRQSKWGQKFKRRKGGRPRLKRPGDKKQFRRAKLAQALRLHCAGKSYREIGRLLNVAPMTIHGWLDQWM